jgi:hypothetical protein
MSHDRHLRGIGQRCLGLQDVTSADVIPGEGSARGTLELVVENRDRVPPSVLAVLAGGGLGIETVNRQGEALVVKCR